MESSFILWCSESWRLVRAIYLLKLCRSGVEGKKAVAVELLRVTALMSNEWYLLCGKCKLSGTANVYSSLRHFASGIFYYKTRSVGYEANSY